MKGPVSGLVSGLFIVGPTASGKSEVCIQIAEQTGSWIINADSIAFFKPLIIGSARPSGDDLARAQHYLLGHRPEGSEYTAGDFRRDVEGLLLQNPGNAKFIISGGSGFYIQAIDRGMWPVAKSDSGIREGLEREADNFGLSVLYDRLCELDPEAGRRISVKDRYRIVRALEMCLLPAPEAVAVPELFSRKQKLGLEIDRDQLKDRIQNRASRMLKAGLIEEVELLRGSGFAKWRPLQSVGYREVLDFLEGRLTREELEPAIVQRTLQLAKKQRTWFKRDNEIRWFHRSEDLVNEALRFFET